MVISDGAPVDDSTLSTNSSDFLETNLKNTVQWIENKFNEFVSDHLTMDQISVACALDYTSLRLNSNWGENNPKLKTWLERLTENNFMKSTLPGESFKYE